MTLTFHRVSCCLLILALILLGISCGGGGGGKSEDASTSGIEIVLTQADLSGNEKARSKRSKFATIDVNDPIKIFSGGEGTSRAEQIRAYFKAPDGTLYGDPKNPGKPLIVPIVWIDNTISEESKKITLSGMPNGNDYQLVVELGTDLDVQYFPENNLSLR